MQILVTGGLGFIGSALLQRLLKAGHRVTIVDALTQQVHGAEPKVAIPEGVEFVHADVRELADRPELIDGKDAVFHLAAETGTGQSMYQIRHYVDVNEGGTAALLEGIAKCAVRPKRVVLTSSRSVYGEGAFLDESGRVVSADPRSRAQLDAAQWELADGDGKPLVATATPEALTFSPGSVYAATKASQELLLAASAQALGFTAVSLRLQNVYGEGQSLQNPYTGIISIFFNRARQGMTLPIYEDGQETRDFVHVDDVTAALVAALDADLPHGGVFNIGSGIATSVLELARTLVEVGGFDVPIEVTGQFRVGDIRHNFADIGAARSALGFAPQIDLAAGLGRFCSWAATQPIYVDRLDAATAELKAKGLAN